MITFTIKQVREYVEGWLGADSSHKFLGFDKTVDVEIKFFKDRSHCYRAIQSFQQRIDRELEKIEAFLLTIHDKN